VRTNAAAAAVTSKGQSVQKLDQLQFINPMWSQIKTEQQFKGVLQKLVESGKCPPVLAAGWADFYNNYRGAIVGSGVPGADETFATSVRATAPHPPTSPCTA
jgi:glycerol-3-phosphate O-acyltransferase